MGNSWFGQDVDTIFAYPTVRVVKINDRTLGVVQKLLTLTIFIYIFIFNIWFNGSHFSHAPVVGITRLQWQEPTKKCNPFDMECEANYKSIQGLPYCKGYKGVKPDNFQQACDYYDARELPANVMDGVFLPTYIAKYQQKRACPEGSATCVKKWQYTKPDGSAQKGIGSAKALEYTFVADVDDFSLLLDHNFHSERGSSQIARQDFEMQGYWKNCKAEDREQKHCTLLPIKCVKGCDQAAESSSFFNFAQPARRSSNRRKTSTSLVTEQKRQLFASEDPIVAGDELAMYEARKSSELAEPISISDGDVLYLNTLLAMAGRSLNDAIDVDGETRSVRSRGMAIVIEIKYENLKRWTLWKTNQPWYTVSVKAMPVDSFKQADVEKIDENTRNFRLSYGTMIIVKQTGSIAFFDPIFALVAFTSAMALLAVANTLTELLMLSVLPRKAEYEKLKYYGLHEGEENPDFNPEKEDAAAASS